MGGDTGIGERAGAALQGRKVTKDNYLVRSLGVVINATLHNRTHAHRCVCITVLGKWTLIRDQQPREGPHVLATVRRRPLFQYLPSPKLQNPLLRVCAPQGTEHAGLRKDGVAGGHHPRQMHQIENLENRV